jgi:hypothetical protein
MQPKRTSPDTLSALVAALAALAILALGCGGTEDTAVHCWRSTAACAAQIQCDGPFEDCVTNHATGDRCIIAGSGLELDSNGQFWDPEIGWGLGWHPDWQTQGRVVDLETVLDDAGAPVHVTLYVSDPTAPIASICAGGQ